MPGLLISPHIVRHYGDELARVEAASAEAIERIVLPEDPDERLDDETCARIEGAYYSIDLWPPYARSFFSAARRAPNLNWMQVPGAGVDHPIFKEMLDRGVRITNASGTTSEPIAQTAIAALLQLARGFPHWHDAQRRHEWSQRIGSGKEPDDLQSQTLVILGLGQIGSAIARIADAIGMRVIGLRRSPRRPNDPIEDVRHVSELDALLPETDWLLIATPLTEETAGMVDARLLARLPQGAHVLNIGRGPIVDEQALIDSLRSGHLGGAYLDVFEQEPLPADSPLWDLPNVILTPHDSAASRGNERRAVELFLRNASHWASREPLENEVHEAGAGAW